MRSELRFTALTYGGDALARLPNGLPVFVPFVLPGERALVQIEPQRHGYARGRLVELLEPSAGRCLPRCRHFGTCGGCQLQHLSYPHQLEAKRGVLVEQLRRLGGLEAEGVVEPAVPSPSPWGYRNSLQLHWGKAARPGFRARRSADIVEIGECHLPEPPLAALWPRLPAPLLRSLGREGGRLALRCGTEGPPLVVPQHAGGPGPLTLGPDGELHGAPPLHFRVGPHTFGVSPASFFQVNTAAAPSLVAQVLRDIPAGEAVVEAHCGVGLFSRFLVEKAATLVCIELAPEACVDFRANLAGSGPVRLVEGRAAQVVPGLAGPCDTLIVDPPRAGLESELVAALPRLQPRQIVYVSCDPATLARDARRLRREAGFELWRATPVDLFPQTYHVETVSVWRR